MQLLLKTVLLVALWAIPASAQAPVPTPRATPTDGCCARCIGKTTDLPYTYDPVIHTQCAAAKGVCCYGCGQDAVSQLTVVNGDFGADGVTPRVHAGAWVQLQWPSTARVTYETFQVGQKKVTTVRNGSNEARESGGYFWVCPKRPGFIYVRGWGPDACVKATKESKIEVVAGESVADSCGRLPTAAKANSAAGSDSNSGNGETSTKATGGHGGGGIGSAQALTRGDIEDSCNTQRASIVTNPDGTKECVCAAEWTGPPSCTGFPWWKIAFTVGGAVAAALSIIVSVKAFVNSRKSNQEAESDGAASLAVEQEPVAGAPSTRRSSHDGYQQHNQDVEVKSSREFSL